MDPRRRRGRLSKLPAESSAPRWKVTVEVPTEATSCPCGDSAVIALARIPDQVMTALQLRHRAGVEGNVVIKLNQVARCLECLAELAAGVVLEASSVDDGKPRSARPPEEHDE